MSRIRRLLNGIAAFSRETHMVGAVEDRRSPAPSDLERLGISVVAFGAINKN